VERAVELGAAADLVDRGVDKAQVPSGVLVGQGYDRGPERRARACANRRADGELAAGNEGGRQAGVLVSVKCITG
jgi:hypothetical protein